MMDHRRRLPAGVIRLVLPSPAGLKSLGDVEPVWGHRIDDVIERTNLRLEAGSAWDIATLAVDSEYRGRAADGLVSLGLYQGVAQLALQCHVKWVVTVLDLVVLNLLQGVMADPFERFAGLEPLPYLDSPASLPVYCDLDAYFAARDGGSVDVRDLVRRTGPGSGGAATGVGTGCRSTAPGRPHAHGVNRLTDGLRQVWYPARS